MDNSPKKKIKVSKEFLQSLKATKELPRSDVVPSALAPAALSNWFAPPTACPPPPGGWPPLPSPEEAKKIVAEMRARGQIPPPCLLPPEQAKEAVEQLKKLGFQFPPAPVMFPAPASQDSFPKNNGNNSSSSLSKSLVQRKPLQPVEGILEQIEEDSIDKISFEKGLNQAESDRTGQSFINELYSRQEEGGITNQMLRSKQTVKRSDDSPRDPEVERAQMKMMIRRRTNSIVEDEVEEAESSVVRPLQEEPKHEEEPRPTTKYERKALQKYNYQKAGEFSKELKLRKTYNYIQQVDKHAMMEQQHSVRYLQRNEIHKYLDHIPDTLRLSSSRSKIHSTYQQNYNPYSHHNSYLDSALDYSIYTRPLQTRNSDVLSDLAIPSISRTTGSIYRMMPERSKPSSVSLAYDELIVRNQLQQHRMPVRLHGHYRAASSSLIGAGPSYAHLY